MFDNAQKLFDEMPERNCTRTVLSFNAHMGACVNSKRFDMAEKIFKEVPEKLSVEPDLVSYNILIMALCKMGSFDSTVSVLEKMEKKDVITFNTILDCLYGNQRFSDAENIWGVMVEKDVVPDILYTAKALQLFIQLWKRWCCPRFADNCKTATAACILTPASHTCLPQQCVLKCLHLLQRRAFHSNTASPLQLQIGARLSLSQ